MTKDEEYNVLLRVAHSRIKKIIERIMAKSIPEVVTKNGYSFRVTEIYVKEQKYMTEKTAETPIFEKVLMNIIDSLLNPENYTSKDIFMRCTNIGNNAIEHIELSTIYA